MAIKIKDWWLWNQIKISQEYCDKCGSADSITIKKKDIKKLIKILKKLDYNGMPKKLNLKDREYTIKEETSWQ